jgi:hypothetical protein
MCVHDCKNTNNDGHNYLCGPLVNNIKLYVEDSEIHAPVLVGPTSRWKYTSTGRRATRCAGEVDRWPYRYIIPAAQPDAEHVSKYPPNNCVY